MFFPRPFADTSVREGLAAAFRVRSKSKLCKGNRIQAELVASRQASTTSMYMYDSQP